MSGAVRYVLGQGNDKETNRPLKVQTGEESRVAWVKGTEAFGFELDSPERIELARKMMEWAALPQNQASRTKKLEQDCLHLTLSWRKHEEPTREEMETAALSALKAIGMERARAIIVAHTDKDHPHVHIVASRIDPQTGRAFSDYRDFTKLEKWAERFDREHGYEAVPGRVAKNEMAQLIAARDMPAILERFTETRATFEAEELRRFLYKNAASVDRRDSCKALTTDILAQHEVVGLRENAAEPVTRYTTRATLTAERDVLRSAARLAERTTHGLLPHRVASTLDAFPHLDHEQRAAFAHLTEARGLGLLAGEAGTGKSTTLAAVREGYEAAGFHVIGMSWKNDVVRDMAEDGFRHTSTIAAELLRLEHGNTEWNRRTVLIVDEAAMLATKHMRQLMDAAAQSGAKLILAGDAVQLASIEAGGMFEQVQARHGAAELHQVRRVQDVDQQRAFNLMHKGEFAPALAIFDRQGAVRWNDTTSDARAALIAQYAADTAVQPDKKRFIFAHTNAQVDALNQDVRALRRERGELAGDDHLLRTDRGIEPYAAGDRIMFTGNAATKEAKALGFVNGTYGTIRQIDGDRVTVELDAKRGQQPRRVAFTVGSNREAGQFDSFRHGYAGTIYKGQGRTLDQTYLLTSDGMRSASSYVALTRHRESVAIFATRREEVWFKAQGGAEALTPDQRQAAERSFESWRDTRAPQTRHSFENFVAFVQAKNAERQASQTQLDRLAATMARVDDRRAASSFVLAPGLNRADVLRQAEAQAAPVPVPDQWRQVAPTATQRPAERVQDARPAVPAPAAAPAAAPPVATPWQPMGQSYQLTANYRLHPMQPAAGLAQWARSHQVPQQPPAPAQEPPRAAPVRPEQPKPAVAPVPAPQPPRAPEPRQAQPVTQAKAPEAAPQPKSRVQVPAVTLLAPARLDAPPRTPEPARQAQPMATAKPVAQAKPPAPAPVRQPDPTATRRQRDDAERAEATRQAHNARQQQPGQRNAAGPQRSAGPEISDAMRERMSRIWRSAAREEQEREQARRNNPGNSNGRGRTRGR